MDVNNRSISSIARDKGIESVLNAILVHLNKYLSFAGKELSQDQKQEICQMIYTNYPYYNPEHIKLFFFRAKMSRYGKISMGEINGTVITEFLAIFDKELDEEIAQHHKQLKKANEPELKIPTNLKDEKKTKAWDLLKKDLEQIGKEADNKVVRPSISFAQLGQEEPSHDLVQTWMKEFDDLYKQTGKLGEQLKQITYDGKRLGLLEFITYKNQQLSES